MKSIDEDCFYSDMFKGVFAKGVASALNGLCEQGRLALFSADDEMLAWYPLKGTEFKAKEIDGKWTVHGVPLSYCRHIKTGISATIKGMTWGAEVIFTSPTNSTHFTPGMDFELYITIQF